MLRIIIILLLALIVIVHFVHHLWRLKGERQTLLKPSVAIHAVWYIQRSIARKIAVIGTSIHSTVLIVLWRIMVVIRVEAAIRDGRLIREPVTVGVLTSWVAAFSRWGGSCEARGYGSRILFVTDCDQRYCEENSPIRRIFGHILSSIWIANEEHQHSGNGSGCWANIIARFAVVQWSFVEVSCERDAQ